MNGSRCLKAEYSRPIIYEVYTCPVCGNNSLLHKWLTNWRLLRVSLIYRVNSVERPLYLRTFFVSNGSVTLPDSGWSRHSELPTACHQSLRRPQTLPPFLHIPSAPAVTATTHPSLNLKFLMLQSLRPNASGQRFSPSSLHTFPDLSYRSLHALRSLHDIPHHGGYRRGRYNQQPSYQWRIGCFSSPVWIISSASRFRWIISYCWGRPFRRICLRLASLPSN